MIAGAEPKILIAAFDGTAGSYDATNSNVVNFVSLLNKDTNSQLSYYQAGVGTYFSPGVVSPMFLWFAKLLDEAFAWYLDVHVMQGYKFLMDNYRPGDKICLFGFSRGAYTARALAGMLHKVGLLPKSNIQQISFAYKAYKQTGKQADELAAGFKQTFSRDVKIEFVGVWDTVQSTGFIMSRSLPFTSSNTVIKTFRHALALDEHRVKFLPNLYHRPRTEEPDPDYVKMPELRKEAHKIGNKSSGKFGSLWNKLWKHGKTFNDKPEFEGVQRVFSKKPMRQPSEVQIAAEEPAVREATDLEANPSPDVEPEPLVDVLEVWFPGCHSDIGGGDVQNSVQVSLPRNTLRWMVEQVILSQCGIVFDEEALERFGMPLSSFPTPQPPLASEVSICQSQPTKDMTGSSTEQDCAVSLIVEELEALLLVSSSNPPTVPSQPSPENCDALAPLFDQLQIQKLWWLLEIIPLPYAYQDAYGKWHKKWGFHMGKGRMIPCQHPKFHISVKERMDYTPLQYKPRAIYQYGHEVFVQ